MWSLVVLIFRLLLSIGFDFKDKSVLVNNENKLMQMQDYENAKCDKIG